jgi:hypothetical protein
MTMTLGSGVPHWDKVVVWSIRLFVTWYFIAAMLWLFAIVIMCALKFLLQFPPIFAIGLTGLSGVALKSVAQLDHWPTKTKGRT